MARPLWDSALGDVPFFRGTFTLNGATPVSVTGVPITGNATFEFSLKTVGGNVGAVPAIQTITPSVPGSPGPQGGPGYNGSFTVVGTAGDTSTYNYRIFN